MFPDAEPQPEPESTLTLIPRGEPTSLALPLFGSLVAAGFPSPADDYIEKSLDLNEYLIKKPSATYFARASGQSMNRLGIFNQDLLIVDRSVNPQHGQIVVPFVIRQSELPSHSHNRRHGHHHRRCGDSFRAASSAATLMI